MNGSKPEIPTAPPNGIGNIAAQAHAIMSKIDQVPFAQIGKDLGQTAQRLEALTSSPEVKQSLEHLDHALANLDEVARTASKDAGPLMHSLRKTADAAQQTVASADAVLGGSGSQQNRNLPEALEEISRAARAMRTLANYLDRHPEALIGGRASQ
jgi:paraquat-inducible protein B